MNTRTINICFVCKSFLENRGGTEAHILSLAKSLSSKGHFVHIIAEGDGIDAKTINFDKNILVHTVKCRKEPFKGYWRIDKLLPISRLRFSFAVHKTLEQLLKKYPIDIVETPDWSVAGFFLVIFKHIPVCIRLHGSPNIGDYYPSKISTFSINSFLTQRMNRYQILKADIVVAVSKYFASFVKNSLNTNRNIIVVPNLLNLDIFKPGSEPKDPHTVLFVGRLDIAKGISVTADAIPIVLSRFPKTKFVFAGKPLQYLDTTKNWADHLNERFGDKNIQILNEIDSPTLVNYYQKSSICIFPSLQEAGGLAAIEAMACQSAVIGSNIGGLAEAIKNNVEGILFDVGDSMALANAIITLLDCPEKRDELAKNAALKARALYSLDYLTDIFLNVYINTINEFKRNDKSICSNTNV